ncbi:hypothetical protein scyTo_0021545, partial [Scyliorhinus torazame]|nr:hypothetical protein [Scyliorhinus torazame]
VIFSHLSSPSDVREALSVAAGALRGEVVTLVDQVGNPVGINPKMPANSERVLGINDFKEELSAKLDVLERRMDADRLRATEIARCTEDIKKLRLGYVCGCVTPASSKRLTPRRDIPTYPK